jgi:hypothetical protein
MMPYTTTLSARLLLLF